MASPAVRRMSRADRHEALLSHAANLVTRDGVAAFGFDELAEEAGVTKTLPYAYFPSKDAVLLALFERVVGALDDDVAAVLAEEHNFETAVRAALEVWFDAVRREGRLLAGLLDGRAVPGLARALAARDQASHRLWQRYAATTLQLPPTSAHVLAAVLNHSATGIVELWVDRRAAKAALVEDFVRAAVGAADALKNTRVAE